MLVDGDHQEELVVATEATGRDRAAIRDDDPAAPDAAQDDAGEQAQSRIDPVEEWGQQSFPASDPPQNW